MGQRCITNQGQGRSQGVGNGNLASRNPLVARGIGYTVGHAVLTNFRRVHWIVRSDFGGQVALKYIRRRGTGICVGGARLDRRIGLTFKGNSRGGGVSNGNLASQLGRRIARRITDIVRERVDAQGRGVHCVTTHHNLGGQVPVTIIRGADSGISKGNTGLGRHIRLAYQGKDRTGDVRFLRHGHLASHFSGSIANRVRNIICQRVDALR